MDKPPFIIGLLENLGSHVDPIKLIQNIPEGLEIPHLQASLIKIMTDYGIQMSLRQGCGKILVSDAVKLMENLYVSQRQAMCFEDKDLACNLCDNKFSADDRDNQIILLFCHHTYHKSCLLSKSPLSSTTTSNTTSTTVTLPHLLLPSATEPTAISSTMARTIRAVYATREGMDAEEVSVKTVDAGMRMPLEPPRVEVREDVVGGLVGMGVGGVMREEGLGGGNHAGMVVCPVCRA
ncbi:Vacuolar protein sorting-associated protein 41 [Podochytrium sp. JEL0797]|nr:Vacuolar protein sorting-associated protein 41 [Podochytrium sp. JEL0797]